MSSNHFSPLQNSSRPLDSAVTFLTSGLTRWDGQYFLHIANNGYSYENTLAFFPLYPVTIRAVADILYWMQVEIFEMCRTIWMPYLTIFQMRIYSG